MTWGGSGSTWAWRKTRARILLRDGYTCQVQGPRCTGTASTVHHTLGRGVSERDDDLQACCKACNDWVGSPESNRDPQPIPKTNW